MKNILSKFSLENFYQNIKIAFIRFPLSFVSSVLMFFVFEYMVYNLDVITQFTQNILLKSILSLITVYFLSIWIYLLSEKFAFSRLKTCLFQLFSILFWIFFYFSFEQNLFNNFYSEELIYIIITFIWVISFVFISSFIRTLLNKSLDNDKYYTFFNGLFSKIIMSMIIWWALTLLWSIALSSIFALFELSSYIDEWKFYWYWISFSLSLFAPIYFLVIAPQRKDNLLLLEKIKENKFYNFLSNYIALPFIIIYFFILYSYSIKVLLNFDSWPKWIISWMVIWFSLFWYLIYIFSYAFEFKSNLVRIFRKIFPFAVFFQTPMLFYAIYLRINQYDFTINRYLVVVFWIFLVLVSLYFIFSKKKNLLAIPLFLTIFIIIISILPWWVYMFPEARQLELLKPDLIEAKILQNSQIVLLKDEKDINEKLSWKIYDKVSYLCGFHWCDSMKNIFWNLLEDIKKQDKIDWEKSHKETIKNLETEMKNYSWTDKELLKLNERNLKKLKAEKYTWIDSWTYSSKLIEKLKVKSYYEWKISNQKYINFSLDYTLRNSLIQVKEYDYLFPIWEDYNLVKESWMVENNNMYYSEYNQDTETIFIYKNKVLLEKFDIKDDFKKIYDKNVKNVDSFWNVTLKEIVSLEKQWTKVDIKVLLEDFWIKNPSYDWIDTYIPLLNWKILLREK